MTDVLDTVFIAVDPSNAVPSSSNWLMLNGKGKSRIEENPIFSEADEAVIGQNCHLL
jgi:hypothetical protein